MRPRTIASSKPSLHAPSEAPAFEPLTHSSGASGASRDSLSESTQSFFESRLRDFPYTIDFTDWTGISYRVGRGEPHFSGKALRVSIKSSTAARKFLSLDILGFLDKFLEGEVDLEGNLYALPDLRRYGRFELKPWHAVAVALRHRAFQSKRRARVSVKSHYDIPQEALNVYLDRTYMSYSCAMFEDPENLDVRELVRAGRGKDDDFDSLEKAQWRKFKDAADYIAPASGETLLDVGCGYGGQLQVALENHPFGKVVGWTHSTNQAREGRRMLAPYSSELWELNEGDYRQDERVFDHITSTGMVSHVGPRGLVPYVRNVRRRIKTGGRYLHHALMLPYCPLPHDFNVGLVFNKKYVWPGYHWFTIGQHVKALEENGFEVESLTNLSRHYAKTTAAWYERMMGRKDTMIANLGEPTFRAWQVFLAGITGSFRNKNTHVYRLYCEAV